MTSILVGVQATPNFILEVTVGLKLSTVTSQIDDKEACFNMALEHRFFCLREGEVSYGKCMNYYEKEFEVSIHDDIMRYMNDTLMWIPCTHLSLPYKKKTKGLSLYGITILHQEDGEMFYHVIDSWYRLFSKAPERFQLDGGIIIKNDRTVSSPPKVYTIEVERDLLLEKLGILLNYANQVIEGEFFILHLGI